MERFTGILGILAILFIAYLMSNNKKNIDTRLVIWGLGLQLLFGIFINDMINMNVSHNQQPQPETNVYLEDPKENKYSQL